MHSRLENNKDLIVFLKNNGYRDDLLDFILNLNDENFKSLKENFSKNKDLLTAMSGKRYNRANEYILDKFYNIKTNDGEYSFLKDKNNVYFQLYKEFIIVLLNQGFNDDYLLQILNQLSFHVDRVNQNYYIDHPHYGADSCYAYGTHIDSNKHFLKYKDVFTTFFRYFSSHSHNYNNACKALMNIGYSELDKYQNNLPLFRLLVQNGFSCRVIEIQHMRRRGEYEDHFGMLYDNFYHYGPEFGVVDSLFSMADYKTLNINNNKELMDLLLEKNLVTFDQGKKDFVTGNPIVSYLLKADRLTISELANDSLAEITEKVKELTQARLKEVQAQSNLPNTHHAKGLNLAEQVIEKLRNNKNEVPLLTTLSVGAILNISQANTLA